MNSQRACGARIKPVTSDVSRSTAVKTRDAIETPRQPDDLAAEAREPGSIRPSTPSRFTTT